VTLGADAPSDLEAKGRECDQVSRVAALAMKRGKSHDFGRYWHRHFADRDTAGSQAMIQVWHFS